jgi:uncharacterized membrane protein YedE/YeeE
MEQFTPWSALVGGAIIGLAACMLLLAHGRIFGVSGIYQGVVTPGANDRVVPVAVLAGLLAAGLVARLIAPAAFDPVSLVGVPTLAAAGFLVGFGTRLGGGCTSGHGVCGLARLSPRSLVATACFVAAGFATVFVVRHLAGGAP